MLWPSNHSRHRRLLAAGVLVLAAVAVVLVRAPAAILRLPIFGASSTPFSLQVYCITSGGLHLAGETVCPTARAMYLRAFLESSSPREPLQWSYHSVDSEALLREGNEGPLQHLPAGAIVIAHIDQLNDVTINEERVAPENQENFTRSSSLLWSLLNASQPLLLLLDDPTCALDWPSGSHHLLYRSAWCTRAHRQWLASQAAESAPWFGARSSWPSVRELPAGLGDSFAQPTLGAFAAAYTRLAALADVPSPERQILFSFRGVRTRYSIGQARLHAALEQLGADRLKPMCERLMRHATPHPPAVGCYVVDMPYSERLPRRVREDGKPFDTESLPSDPPFETAGRISPLELLRSSIFTLVPAGHFYSSTHLWEAIEAGSIPIVQKIDGEYNNCFGPSEHLLATVDGILHLTDWDELPSILEQEMANMPSLRRRQMQLRAWWGSYKATTRAQLLSAVDAMNASWHGEPNRWHPQTQCGQTPHHPWAVADQHEQLRHYWRNPQPSKPWLTLSEPRPFSGSDGFCSDPPGADFHEPCLAKGCSPPLVADVWCNPV
ncbi:hypothetical protein AB1Y20_002317 [Prymnesium parvum]|uniref:RXYLT1 C-terminal domain-containing protein n=1 Tax=Prymnesium parvum TaxID=97485 RepID=A0AB34JBC6_PRYPA